MNQVIHSVVMKHRKSTRLFLSAIALILFACSAAFAQTGGEGGIQGTVTDSTGAVIPKATVTVTNIDTKVSNTTTATGDGLYTVSPIIPGTYTVRVTAEGFGAFTQENLRVDALKLTGLNVTLQNGATNAEVTVTGAPPALETTNAVLGNVIENQTYSNLPLQMSGQQRDPTAFAVLTPGVQSGTRAPVIGGTGNFLAAVYVDGLPTTTINQQGDNRVVSNALPVEAIDQFQVLTSTPPAEYGGAGLINFTFKSGGSRYHGQGAIYVRNTIFDAWSYAGKAATQKDANGNTIAARKPYENQNEIVGSVGGPIPFTHDKAHFQFTYDRYHGRNGINPQITTVPTTRMRTGDFSELTTGIYDPTTNHTTGCLPSQTVCRTRFPGNVIPASELSPIALKMQSYLPAVSNSGVVNNALVGVPSGFDNWAIATREDYRFNDRHQISFVAAIGKRENVPFTVGNNGVVLPLPYTQGGTALIKPTVMDVEYNWTVRPNMVNQLKYGFTRFSQPVGSLTQNKAGYTATDLGITNLLPGQASEDFPGVTFGTTTLYPTAISQWTSAGASGATQTTVPNAYTLLDNFLWTKGSHSLTIGGQIQWLQDNVASQLGPSSIIVLPYTANSTADFAGSALSPSTTGYSYASFLLGATGQSSITNQAVAETGGRYRTVAPYIQDDWKVTPKLTVNIGLRWDYLPPFREVKDRWSFLNADITNPVTGNKGALQFAGNGPSGLYCNCRTPVQTWWKNFGPRVGVAYAITPRTVLRAGYGLAYSIGGGVGGRAGAGNGTGALGYNSTATTPTEVTTGTAAAPSFYLNNSAYFGTIGKSNTAYGGPGFALPTNAAITASSQTLNTGNYVNGTTNVTAGTMAFADPYLSGRAPQFHLFNAGLQQALTNNVTMTLNYAGTISHFLLPAASNARGYWSNQLDPKYLALLGDTIASDGKTSILLASATAANIAIVQAKTGVGNPFPSQTFSTTQTIAQMLVAFPQYSGVTDTWGQNVANLNYHSLQLTIAQRAWKGLSYTVNYTWSKNLGDDGTFRSGFDIPAAASSDGVAHKMNRLDYGETVLNIPQNVSAYFVWESPFGKNKMGANSWALRNLAGGWTLSGIYRFNSGVPLVITSSSCTAPKQGQCQPDLNPAFNGKSPIRNGGFGKGTLANNFGTISYLDPAAFQPTATFNAPGATTQVSKIGTAPRTAPYGLHAPSFYNVDLGLSRSFNLTPERFKLVLNVNCLNVFNHTTLSNIATAWSATSTSFGSVGTASATPRDFQLAGKITF